MFSGAEVRPFFRPFCWLVLPLQPWHTVSSWTLCTGALFKFKFFICYIQMDIQCTILLVNSFSLQIPELCQHCRHVRHLRHIRHIRHVRHIRHKVHNYSGQYSADNNKYLYSECKLHYAVLMLLYMLYTLCTLMSTHCCPQTAAHPRIPIHNKLILNILSTQYLTLPSIIIVYINDL